MPRTFRMLARIDQAKRWTEYVAKIKNKSLSG